MKTIQWIYLGVFFITIGCTGKSISQTTPAIPETTSLEAASLSQGATSESVEVSDALGRKVTFSSPPRRIVVTGKALFMIADAIYMFPEAGERIVGLGSAGQGTRNFISLIDPNYDRKAILENDAGAEQVAALNPDLVMLKSYLSETVGHSYEALKIPVVYIDFETPEQYERDVRILGSVFQNESRANEIIDFYQKRVIEIEKRVAGEAKPVVLILSYSETDGKVAFNVPPPGWIQTQMTALAGGEAVWTKATPGKGWSQVTLEQIAAWDADYIFIVSYFSNPYEVVAELKSDPLWQSLRATTEGHLYAFPGDMYSWDQPDPRWILGLSWMAATLHPQQFPDYDSRLLMQEFYHTLYGLDTNFIQRYIYPLYQGGGH